MLCHFFSTSPLFCINPLFSLNFYQWRTKKVLHCSPLFEFFYTGISGELIEKWRTSVKKITFSTVINPLFMRFLKQTVEKWRRFTIKRFY